MVKVVFLGTRIDYVGCLIAACSVLAGCWSLLIALLI
jgi:hypothetical protein